MDDKAKESKQHYVIIGYPKKQEQYQTDYAKRVQQFGLERGVHGSEAKHRTTIEYYKEILKATKEKEAQKAELKAKIKELEKQAGKLCMKGTLYSIFGNSELDQKQRSVLQTWSRKPNDNSIFLKRRRMKSKKKSFSCRAQSKEGTELLPN